MLALGLWASGFWALPLWGEVWFSDLDLTAYDRLLFRAEAESPGFGPYRTLFAAELSDGRLEQLTFFPEKVSLVAGVLQVQNRFGLFRTDAALANPAPVAGLPAFVTGGQVESGKLDLVASSPDGRWLLALRPTSAAYGELLLYDLKGGPASVASSGVELSLKAIPVLWSPDSDFFLYSKRGRASTITPSASCGRRGRWKSPTACWARAPCATVAGVRPPRWPIAAPCTTRPAPSSTA